MNRLSKIDVTKLCIEILYDRKLINKLTFDAIQIEIDKQNSEHKKESIQKQENNI